MKLLNRLTNMAEEESVEHKVNPVYDTAKSCLVNLERANCKEAARLNERLGISASMSSDNAISHGIALFQETRYRFVNDTIEASKYRNIFDIGCGFSPRGLYFAEMGYKYVGADLPGAINGISPAVEACIDDSAKENIKYCGVDATDPNALRDAAGWLDGPVCIVTEGVMMYFPIYELREYIKGLKNVLAEHGGCVITPDFCMNRLLKVCAASTTGKMVGELLQKSAGKVVSEYTINSNDKMDPSVWYSKEDDEEPYQFFTENGFRVERIPVFSDDTELASLSGVKDSKKVSLIADLKKTYGWKMTLI